MQKIEQATRHALDKIDASKPGLRQKVYETIWHAHEQSLIANKQLSNAEKAKRRNQLARLLKSIEAEYHSPPKNTGGRLDIAPGSEKRASPASGIGPEEEKPNPAIPSVMVADDRPKHQHKRSWLGAHALLIILIVITVFIIWSFYNSLTGTVGLTENHPSSIAPMRLSAHEQNGWIQVFNPGDITSLAVRGAAMAEVHNEAGANFVRIRANTPGDAAIIEIGQGALMKLRGKTATLNIIARSADRNMTQLSLTCDFGDGEMTGRKRFEVSPTAGPLLFQVNIPQSINNPAKLYVSSDLLGQKHEVDIFSVLINAEH